MASPRSRLVTWSYTHLSFHGRRFWRPHPDLDRAATPALPPGGGRPLCGGWFPLLAAPPGRLRGRPRKPFARGPSPRNPHVRQARGGRALGARCGRALARDGRALGAGGGGCWGRVIAGLRRPFLSVHRLHFTDSHETDTDFRVTNGLYVTLRTFAYGTFRRSVAYGGGGLGWSPGRRPMWGRRTARRPAGFPAAAPPPAWPAARSRCHISGTARTTGNRPGTRSS